MVNDCFNYNYTLTDARYFTRVLYEIDMTWVTTFTILQNMSLQKLPAAL